MIKRVLAVATAFAVGWIVYMVGMILTTYEGLLSLILQPIMAAVVSGLFVCLALLVGLCLQLSWFRWWKRGPLPAAVLAGISLGILTFGYFLGITYVGVHPETDSEVLILHPAAALAGYFGLLFAVANWPVRQQARSEGTV